MKICWTKNRDDEKFEFETTNDFMGLAILEQVIVLSKFQLDLKKVRNHMLIVCFIRIFGVERDEKLLGHKLSSYRNFLTSLGLDVDEDFEALAKEHLQGISFPNDIKPCLICDRWTYRK